MSSSATSAYSLPPEITWRIFEHERGNAKFITDMRLVCKEFKALVECVNAVQIKCLFALNLARNLNAQIKSYSKEKQCIISDDRPAHPSDKKITSKEISDYLAMIHSTSSDKMKKSFAQFKESLIDALHDANHVNILKLPDLPSYIENSDENFVLTDVLKKAQNRVKGDVYLIPIPAGVVGKQEQEPSRRYGDYGTEGGFLASVSVCAVNNRSNNWHDSRWAPVRIDYYLPGKLFLGKKEGDSITFAHEGKEVKLRCNQSSYIHGVQRFEEVFLKVTELGTMCNSDNYPPPLSEDEQKKKIQELHESYKASIPC